MNYPTVELQKHITVRTWTCKMLVAWAKHYQNCALIYYYNLAFFLDHYWQNFGNFGIAVQFFGCMKKNIYDDLRVIFR